MLDLEEQHRRLPGLSLEPLPEDADLALSARQLAAQLSNLRGQLGERIRVGHMISSSGSGFGMSPSVSTDSHHCR